MVPAEAVTKRSQSPAGTKVKQAKAAVSPLKPSLSLGCLQKGLPVVLQETAVETHTGGLVSQSLKLTGKVNHQATRSPYLEKEASTVLTSSTFVSYVSWTKFTWRM